LQQIDHQICEVQRGNKNWGEPLSMSDGGRLDDGSQKRPTQDSESELQMSVSRYRPTLLALPFPTLLVG